MIFLTGFRVKTSLLAACAVGLLGCQGGIDGVLSGAGKAEAPVPKKLINKMKAYGMTTSSPIMIRIFKEEDILEVWKQKDTGRYGKLADFEICKWSGKYGPKFKEGDRQAPEGFYTVNKHQLNPNSQYHLSFNMGFPNAYDRSHGRTGSHLMIHGACSSSGCYSMTDEQVQTIYALARDALRGGQKKFQIQAYPFRMTPENMFKHRGSEHFEFWQMLKRGYDHFEITNVPPKVDVCNRKYVFNTTSGQRYPSNGSCPAMAMPESLALAFSKRQNDHMEKFEALLAKTEKRDVTFQPLELDQTLPGITVIRPQPPEPDVTEQTETAAKPAEVKEETPTSSATTAPATATETTAEPAKTAEDAATAAKPADPFAAEAKALEKKKVGAGG